MQIRIINNKFDDNIWINYKTVRVKQITNQEMNEYRQTFGKIVADNIGDYSYLLSDLLNREDGSTHFLDKLLRYLECIKLIEENKNITFYNLDSSVFISIKNYCISRNIKASYSMSYIAFSTIKNYTLLLMRMLRTLFCESLMIFYAKWKLNSKIDPSLDTVFISYFDHRSITNGKFTDPFFKPLQEYLQEMNSPFGVVNIIMCGHNLKKGISYINNIKKLKKNNITTLFNLISHFDLINTFIKSYKFRPRLKSDVFFKNNNITDLLRENLKCEFFSFGLQHTLERSYLIKLLKCSYIDAIYYPFENFAWEKFLCLEKERINANVKLIGFQHTSFSFRLEHHFPSKYEKNLKIFPSKIVTVGEIPYNVLQKKGSFPDGIMRIGCALRHEYIFEILKNFKCSNKVNRKVAFAFSCDVTRYKYITEKLVSIYGGRNIELILKYHPLHKDILFDREVMPTNIIDGISIPWHEVMKQIDLLLYEGNCMCIDALAYNIPVQYFPFTGDIYDTDQLYDYGWDIDAGNEESTYYEKTEKILNENLKNNQDFFNYNRKYVMNYFSPISKDALQTFLD